jgi:hypothetical protein
MFVTLFQVVGLMSILSLEAIVALSISVVLPVFLVSMFSFIPAVIELKRPRDAGPRIIAGAGCISYSPSIIAIDMDKSLLVIKPVPKFSVIFPLLPNLET